MTTVYLQKCFFNSILKDILHHNWDESYPASRVSFDLPKTGLSLIQQNVLRTQYFSKTDGK